MVFLIILRNISNINAKAVRIVLQQITGLISLLIWCATNQAKPAKSISWRLGLKSIHACVLGFEVAGLSYVHRQPFFYLIKLYQLVLIEDLVALDFWRPWTIAHLAPATVRPCLSPVKHNQYPRLKILNPRRHMPVRQPKGVLIVLSECNIEDPWCLWCGRLSA